VTGDTSQRRHFLAHGAGNHLDVAHGQKSCGQWHKKQILAFPISFVRFLFII
jgi:hypothetical protein